MIVQVLVNVVQRRTVVVDPGQLSFDNRCRSHLYRVKVSCITSVDGIKRCFLT